MTEAELSMMRRLGASEDNMLGVQTNLASTYQRLGRMKRPCAWRHVYSGRVRLDMARNMKNLIAASNYAWPCYLERFEEAKALLRKTMPVARRVLGESSETTLKMRWTYAAALYNNTGATLDDLREAATTLEDPERSRGAFWVARTR